ncbi:hypothetical protein ACFL6E_05635 [Candidatus Neomarinimicrobiota bacterium]
MDHITPQFKQMLHVNADRSFYVQWVDRLDELYQVVNDWIIKMDLTADAHEMRRIASWLAPCLCTKRESKKSKLQEVSQAPEGTWRQLISQMYQLYEKDPMHKIMGTGHSDLERQLSAARCRKGQFSPRRGNERQILDQGLGYLFRHLNTIGLSTERQKYVVLELFKALRYDGFPDMPTARAYKIIERLRKQTIPMPDTYLDELVASPN